MAPCNTVRALERVLLPPSIENMISQLHSWKSFVERKKCQKIISEVSFLRWLLQTNSSEQYVSQSNDRKAQILLSTVLKVLLLHNV